MKRVSKWTRSKRLRTVCIVVLFCLGMTACASGKFWKEFTFYVSEESVNITELADKIDTVDTAEKEDRAETVETTERADQTGIPDQILLSGFSLPDSLLSASVGDTVYFGSYEQDGDRTDGTEEIAWRVIDIQGNCVLLLSSYVLDEVPYHNEKEESMGITWETCSLRSWLNSDFLNAAFSEAEQQFLCRATVCTLRSGGWQSVNSADTRDAVFILDAKELNTYLPDYHDRTVKSTAYGNQSGHKGTAPYWLRSNAIRNQMEVRYTEDGSFGTKKGLYSEKATKTGMGVRPAVWVSLTGDTSQELVMGEDRIARYVQVGDVIPFGTYRQLVGITNMTTDLEWRVLDIEGDRLLLITENCLDEKMAFHSGGDNSLWEDSTIRKWLNEDFIGTAFSGEEISGIQITTVVTDGSEDTGDRVFLLSEEEAERYFLSNEERKANGLVRANSSVRKPCNWYLRTKKGSYVYYVSERGEAGHLFTTGPQKEMWIRPALWVQDESMLIWGS